MSNRTRIQTILRALGLDACEHQVDLYEMYEAIYPEWTPTALASPLAKAQVKRG